MMVEDLHEATAILQEIVKPEHDDRTMQYFPEGQAWRLCVKRGTMLWLITDFADGSMLKRRPVVEHTTPESKRDSRISVNDVLRIRVAAGITEDGKRVRDHVEFVKEVTDVCSKRRTCHGSAQDQKEQRDGV